MTLHIRRILADVVLLATGFVTGSQTMYLVDRIMWGTGTDVNFWRTVWLGVGYLLVLIGYFFVIAARWHGRGQQS